MEYFGPTLTLPPSPEPLRGGWCVPPRPLSLRQEDEAPPAEVPVLGAVPEEPVIEKLLDHRTERRRLPVTIYVYDDGTEDIVEGAWADGPEDGSRPRRWLKPPPPQRGGLSAAAPRGGKFLTPKTCQNALFSLFFWIF